VHDLTGNRQLIFSNKIYVAEIALVDIDVLFLAFDVR
jgi:hypothetical protein